MSFTGFGYWRACPEDACIAWGARAILNRGTIDLLYDRQSWNGVAKENVTIRKGFSKLINQALPAVRDEVERLCSLGLMRGDKAAEFVLFESSGENGIRIVGNTNGSCGYLYLVAYPYEG